MKRKIVCNCGDSVYVLLTGAYAVTQSGYGECLKCGDKRRMKEQDKKATTRLMSDEKELG